MLLARVIASIVSGIVALFILHRAWNTEDVLLWFIGVLLFLAGLLFILSALHARRHVPPKAAATPPGPPPEGPVYQPPMLGDLLIHKYQCINSAILQQALELQKGTTKQLGDILLELGVITPNELKMAIDDQEKYKFVPWFNEAWAYRRYQTQQLTVTRPDVPGDETESAPLPE